MVTRLSSRPGAVDKKASCCVDFSRSVCSRSFVAAEPEAKTSPEPAPKAAPGEKPGAESANEAAESAAEEAEPVEPVTLAAKLETGQRYTGSNVVIYELEMTVREGRKSSKTKESVKRTERFVDRVLRAGSNGVIEIERSYLKLFSTVMNSSLERKIVQKSPLKGRVVKIKEQRRNRILALEGRGGIDSLVRRTAGIEIDWRDAMPDEPVRPGDEWTPDVSALTRRFAAYLNCGTRGKMRVRYEGDIDVKGHRMAKLYVDWTIQGMRDRHLFTKVVVAGDVLFDREIQRVVDVDLSGSMIVRGAIILEEGSKIFKGEGPVSLRMQLRAPKVEASAGEEQR